MDYKYDKKVLDTIGLNDFDAIDFFQKQESFVGSLSEKQHVVVQKAFPSWEDAAQAIDPQMKAEDLKDFVARRSPRLAAYPVVALIFPGDDGEDGESPDLPTPTTPPTPPPPANPDPSDGK